MATLARLSHAGFNVPRELYQKECDFWEKIIGLKLVRKNDRIAFFTSDPLRDHEFILYAVDGPVSGYGQNECILNHLAFTCEVYDLLLSFLQSLLQQLQDLHRL